MDKLLPRRNNYDNFNPAIKSITGYDVFDVL